MIFQSEKVEEMLAACLAKYQANPQMQVDHIYRSNTNNSTNNTSKTS